MGGRGGKVLVRLWWEGRGKVLVRVWWEVGGRC